MKRILIVIITAIIITFSVRAQVSVEVQSGLNIANLSNPGNLAEGAVWKSRFGIVGGASLAMRLTDRLLFSPGLRFVQKGTTSEWSSWLGQIDATATYNYLELPVYLEWEVADFNSKLFIIGGPVISYLLSSRLEGNGKIIGSVSSDTKENYKSYDASFDLGCSLRTPLNQDMAFIITGLYSYGFINISDLGSKEKTRDVRFMVGVSYRLSE